MAEDIKRKAQKNIFATSCVCWSGYNCFLKIRMILKKKTALQSKFWILRDNSV